MPVTPTRREWYATLPHGDRPLWPSIQKAEGYKYQAWVKDQAQRNIIIATQPGSPRIFITLDRPAYLSPSVASTLGLVPFPEKSEVPVRKLLLTDKLNDTTFDFRCDTYLRPPYGCDACNNSPLRRPCRIISWTGPNRSTGRYPNLDADGKEEEISLESCVDCIIDGKACTNVGLITEGPMGEKYGPVNVSDEKERIPVGQRRTKTFNEMMGIPDKYIVLTTAMQKARKKEALANSPDRGVKRAGEVLEQESTPKRKNPSGEVEPIPCSLITSGSQICQGGSSTRKRRLLLPGTATTTTNAHRNTGETPTLPIKPLPTSGQPVTTNPLFEPHGHSESEASTSPDPASTPSISQSGPGQSLPSQSAPSQSDSSQSALSRPTPGQSTPKQSATNPSTLSQSTSTEPMTISIPSQLVSTPENHPPTSQSNTTLHEAINVANGVAASPDPSAPLPLPVTAVSTEQQVYRVRPASEFDLSADPVHKYVTGERYVKSPNLTLDFQLATHIPVHMWPHNIESLGLERWIPKDRLLDSGWRDGLVKLKRKKGLFPLWWAFMYRRPSTTCDSCTQAGVPCVFANVVLCDNLSEPGSQRMVVLDGCIQCRASCGTGEHRIEKCTLGGMILTGEKKGQLSERTGSIWRHIIKACYAYEEYATETKPMNLGRRTPGVPRFSTGLNATASSQDDSQMAQGLTHILDQYKYRGQRIRELEESADELNAQLDTARKSLADSQTLSDDLNLRLAESNATHAHNKVVLDRAIATSQAKDIAEGELKRVKAELEAGSAKIKELEASKQAWLTAKISAEERAAGEEVLRRAAEAREQESKRTIVELKVQLELIRSTSTPGLP